MHHSAAILPSELTAPDDDRLLHSADMKHSASELTRGERSTLLFACVPRTATHSYDDRD
jgi:hypothetical protein